MNGRRRPFCSTSNPADSSEDTRLPAGESAGDRSSWPPRGAILTNLHHVGPEKRPMGAERSNPLGSRRLGTFHRQPVGTASTLRGLCPRHVSFRFIAGGAARTIGRGIRVDFPMILWETGPADRRSTLGTEPFEFDPFSMERNNFSCFGLTPGERHPYVAGSKTVVDGGSAW